MAWVCSITPLAADPAKGIATAVWNKGMDDTITYSRLCTIGDPDDQDAFTSEAQAAYDSAATLRAARQQFSDGVAGALNTSYAASLAAEQAIEAADLAKQRGKSTGPFLKPPKGS